MYHSSDFCRYEWRLTNRHPVKPTPSMFHASASLLCHWKLLGDQSLGFDFSPYLGTARLQRVFEGYYLEFWTTLTLKYWHLPPLPWAALFVTHSAQKLYVPFLLCSDYPKQQTISVTNHIVCRQVTEVASPQWPQLSRFTHFNKELQYYHHYFLLLFLVGWDWVHLVLRPPLAYYTSPRW
jgi:hypothetical protein